MHIISHPIQAVILSAIQVVILSAAGISRSEAPAESKDPCILSLTKDVSGNSPARWNPSSQRRSPHVHSSG